MTLQQKQASTPIATAVQAWRKVAPSPAAQALLLGGGTYLLSRLAWNPVVETIRSLGRIPGKALSKMTDAEWAQAMAELKADPAYRKWLPIALGGSAALASTGLTWAPNREYFGQFSWDAPVTFDADTSNKKWREYLRLHPDRYANKTASLHKRADDMFEYTGYVPDIDLSQVINARNAQSLFTNDPFLQNDAYVKNMGTAIVANAAIQQHTNKPTLGGVFDSAVDKIENKLTFGGLAEVGVKSVIANATARMFTNVLGKMVSMSPETQRNLVDAGTWAGTISAILH